MHLYSAEALATLLILAMYTTMYNPSKAFVTSQLCDFVEA